MIFSKKLFYYYFTVSAFYLSIFLPILTGIIRKMIPSLELYFQLILQGYIYIVPLYLVLFLKLNTKRMLLVALLYLYLFSTQFFTDYGSLSGFLLGFKSLVLLFLYIPILQYLVENDYDFPEKIERHIKVIFFAALFVCSFEIMARYISNAYYQQAYEWFLSLSNLGGGVTLKYSRPIGITLNIHFQAMIFALAVIYYFIYKKYFFVFIFLFALFLIAVKTWVIGLTLVLVLFYLKDIYKIRFKYLVLSLVGIYLVGLFFYAQVEHYKSQTEISSYGVQTMSGLWLGSFDVIVDSILPHGFTTEEDRLSKLPYNVRVAGDAFLIFYIYSIGTFGVILYVLITYYTIFKKSIYTPIVFLSLFAMIHTNPMQIVGIFIMVLYFGMYYIVQNRKKCTELPNINVFKDTSV